MNNEYTKESQTEVAVILGWQSLWLASSAAIQIYVRPVLNLQVKIKGKLKH